MLVIRTFVVGLFIEIPLVDVINYNFILFYIAPILLIIRLEVLPVNIKDSCQPFDRRGLNRLFSYEGFQNKGF